MHFPATTALPHGTQRNLQIVQIGRLRGTDLRRKSTLKPLAASAGQDAFATKIVESAYRSTCNSKRARLYMMVRSHVHDVHDMYMYITIANTVALPGIGAKRTSCACTSTPTCQKTKCTLD